MCSFINYGFAHDTNKCFFKIIQESGVIKVEAEFPWTMRNAVLEEFPELTNSKSQEDFDTALFNYIKSNFIVKNEGENLELISVNNAPNNGHSHQNNFVFVFDGNQFNSISNTIMFNINTKQTNYHEILINNEIFEYITLSKTMSFNVDLVSRRDNNFYLKIGIITIVLSILIGLTFLKFNRKVN